MNATIRILFIALLTHVLGASVAAPRDTAFQKAQHAWSVGVFNPLRYQLSENWASKGIPVQLAHPHATVEQTWRTGKNRALTGRYGLSAQLVLRLASLLRGYLSPNCIVSDAEPERGLECGQRSWAVAPLVGRYS